MKPFDPTKPYCRRDKRPSKIIYTTSDGRHVVITEDDANYEYAYEVNPLGRLIDIDREEDDPADLINIPEKIEGWVNVYKSDEIFTVLVYQSKREADTIHSKDRVACIKVSFMEGEGI